MSESDFDCEPTKELIPNQNVTQSSREAAGSGKSNATESPTFDQLTLDASEVALPKTRGASAFDVTLDSEIANRSTLGLNETIEEHAIGLRIGNYEVLSQLGRGGMGVVYKAKHVSLDRVVALKMILNGLHGGQKVIERFLAEAKAIAALQHPGIVQIFEIGEHESLPFIALEFIEGRDLQSEIQAGKAWSSIPAAELVAQICDAMQFAHDQGILHRDIKPANILLDKKRRPKVTDFGLAKRLDNGDQLTKDGTIMGTPSYMPPEQARGDTAAISPRSDIYSLGALLYHLITGRVPFVSDSMMETLTQVVQRDPIQPRELQPGIPIDLETICVKSLQKDPAARYQSCSEFADDLRRFCRGEPILARPISQVERLARWCKRNPKIAIPSFSAIFFIVATLMVSLWAWRTTAAQAIVIADERDTANKQREIAQEKKEEADRQTIIANEQRKRAEENSDLATKQANLALQSLQFLLSDVDLRLSELPGASEVRISVLKEVSKKWDELDLALVGGIRGEAVPTLMSARQRLANTYIQLDRIPEAAAELEKLEKQGRERVVLKNGTDASRLNLAKFLLSSSQLQRRIDKPSMVSEKLRECIDILQEVLDKPNPEGKPTDILAVRQLLAIANQNLGVDFLRQGKLSETERCFENALKSNIEVLGLLESISNPTEPDKHRLQVRDLKVSIDKSRLGLAYILMRQEKKAEALVKYEEAIRSRRIDFENNPGEISLKSALANQLALFGRSLLWLNETEKAEPIFREAIKLCDEVHKSDPEKADLKRDAAFAYYFAGVLRSMQGKNDFATGLFERSRLLRQELFNQSPDEKNRMLLMQSEARVGNVERAIQLSEELASKPALDSEVHIERSCAIAQCAVISASDEAQKEKLLSSSLLALDQAVKAGYEDPFRIQNDPDLAPLKSLPGFQTLIQSLKSSK